MRAHVGMNQVMQPVDDIDPDCLGQSEMRGKVERRPKRIACVDGDGYFDRKQWWEVEDGRLPVAWPAQGTSNGGKRSRACEHATTAAVHEGMATVRGVRAPIVLAMGALGRAGVRVGTSRQSSDMASTKTATGARAQPALEHTMVDSCCGIDEVPQLLRLGQVVVLTVVNCPEPAQFS